MMPTRPLAVQWHPEWRPREHPLHDALFRGFAGACRMRQADTAGTPLTA